MVLQKHVGAYWYRNIKALGCTLSDSQDFKYENSIIGFQINCVKDTKTLIISIF